MVNWGPEHKFASFAVVTRNDYVIGKKKVRKKKVPGLESPTFRLRVQCVNC